MKTMPKPLDPLKTAWWFFELTGLQLLSFRSCLSALSCCLLPAACAQMTFSPRYININVSSCCTMHNSSDYQLKVFRAGASAFLSFPRCRCLLLISRIVTSMTRQKKEKEMRQIKKLKTKSNTTKRLNKADTHTYLLRARQRWLSLVSSGVRAAPQRQRALGRPGGPCCPPFCPRRRCRRRRSR